jgi:hypothetical protein
LSASIRRVRSRSRVRCFLDVVELITESGRWPVGAVGTVVEADDRTALVEIAGDRGHALDFVSLPTTLWRLSAAVSHGLRRSPCRGFESLLGHL